MGPDLTAFDQHRYLSLATFRQSGVEVRTPVWFAATGGRLYIFTAADSGKVKRLRHSSRARIAPSDMSGGIRGEWRDASARIVTDPSMIEEAHQAMRAKYGWQLTLTDLLSRLTGRIRRRAWVAIEERRDPSRQARPRVIGTIDGTHACRRSARQGPYQRGPTLQTPANSNLLSVAVPCESLTAQTDCFEG